MAKLVGPGGIKPQGKTGGFTFYQLNGQTIMRRLPANHRNKTHPTPLQLIYRQRFKEINAFLKPLKEVLNFGFKNQSTQSRKGIHCAYQELVQKGYNFGQEPRIDPAYLKISSGHLLGPEEVGLSRDKQLISLTWRDHSNRGSSFRHNKVMVFLLHPDSGTYYWFPEAGNTNQSEVSVQIKVSDLDRIWCVYLSFYLENSPGKHVFSDSFYAGCI